jgi:hypothetical protein
VVFLNSLPAIAVVSGWWGSSLVYLIGRLDAQRAKSDDCLKCQNQTGRAYEHEIKLIVFLIMLSWMWALPTALYPGAPPS